MNTIQIPQSVKEWLIAQRHIGDDVLQALQIKYIEKHTDGHSWIYIPILDQEGNEIGAKLRKTPESNAPQKTMNTKGSKASLYPLPYLHNNLERVLLCEGELDTLALLSLGIEAICSTAGAATFKQEWLDSFPENIEVCLCYDLDEAGAKGQEKVAALFREHRPDVVLTHVCLPEHLGEGGDISDFIGHCKNSDLDPLKAIEALINPLVNTIDSPKTFSVTTVKKPSSEVTFEQWCDAIKTEFYELFTASEAIMSVVCQLLIKDISNCFLLVLVDMPSSGKTITLNFFDKIEGITYASDSFTPASFVSNAANVAKEKLANIDLLPRIRRKLFMVRDMATIFSARDDDLLKNMGILTRISDGEGMTTDTGIHGQRALEGDYVFMMAAASTPIPPKVWKVMGALGQRLFQLSIGSGTKSEDELVSQLQNTSYKDKEKKCNKITQNRLYTIWNQHPNGIIWEKEKDPKECLQVIVRCAVLLSKLRAQVFTYNEKTLGTSENISYARPTIEKPDRLNQTLYNLARGHAVAAGRTNLTREDLAIVLRIALDSGSGDRPAVFRELLRKAGTIDTKDVEELLNVSDNTARRRMDEMVLLGICSEIDADTSIKFTIKLNDEFSWFLSKDCKNYLNTQGHIRDEHSSQI